MLNQKFVILANGNGDNCGRSRSGPFPTDWSEFGEFEQELLEAISDYSSDPDTSKNDPSVNDVPTNEAEKVTDN